MAKSTLKSLLERPPSSTIRPPLNASTSRKMQTIPGLVDKPSLYKNESTSCAAGTTRSSRKESHAAQTRHGTKAPMDKRTYVQTFKNCTPSSLVSTIEQSTA